MAKVDSKSAYTFEKQPRLILAAFHLMCTDTQFLRMYRTILIPEHWSEMEGKWVIGEVVAHYEEEMRAPGFQTLRMRLDADTHLKDDQEELVGRFLNKLDDILLDNDTIAFVTENFESFIKYRATLYGLRQAHEYLQDDDNDAAVEAVLESQSIRLVRDDWHFLPNHADSYFKYFSEENIAKISIPIGIPPLDSKLKGGLRRGELGVIVASLGVGKSMALVHIGAAAYRLGKKVAHFTFENSWEETMARYMHNLLRIDSDALSKMDANHPVYNERATEMDLMGGDISIIELPGSDTSALDIQEHLHKLEEMGKYPDVILLDYADLMRSGRRSSRRSDRWVELGAIYEELRQVAANADVPIWTASQANREGMKAKGGVRGYHVGGALGKLNVADVGITISREQRDVDKDIRTGLPPDDDDEDNEIDNEFRIWRVIKLRRGGEDGWKIRLRAAYSQARFEVVDEGADIDKEVDAALDRATHRLPNAAD